MPIIYINYNQYMDSYNLIVSGVVSSYQAKSFYKTTKDQAIKEFKKIHNLEHKRVKIIEL